MKKVEEPFILVIFGVSGDLTKRKIAPSLYNLFAEGYLPENFAVVGFSRRIATRASLHAWIERGIENYGDLRSQELWNSFKEHLYSIQADLYDKDSFRRLRELLIELNDQWNCNGNLIFYLATAPSHFPTIVENLGEYNLNKGLDHGWARLVIEKPFGLDLESAITLNKKIRRFFAEEQIFRIDHYLGKESVRNLLIFRLANTMFRPIWNRRYIDHIQITVAETIGVDKRAEYFEQTGALRDMVQSHLLQILALITMEPPTSLHSDAIRDRKVELFRSIKRIDPAKVNEYTVRGQYDAGRVVTPKSGDHVVVGYRSENGVDPKSNVETYVALKLEIANDRWDGVPIYLRTGKRLRKRVGEVVIQFRTELFGTFRDREVLPEPNLLIIRFQPERKIILKVNWEPPGIDSEMERLILESHESESTRKEPRAYERLLLDIMRNKSKLFIRQDEVEECWRVIMPILEGWKRHPPPKFPNYEAGTDGPKIADEFIERDGRKWYPLGADE